MAAARPSPLLLPPLFLQPTLLLHLERPPSFKTPGESWNTASRRPSTSHLLNTSRAYRRSPWISKRKRNSSLPLRRRKCSVTPTRTPVSSSRYNHGALVPYSLRNPGSKSGISHSDINQWRAATVGGTDFTYSSKSSITQSSVTLSSVSSSSCSSSSCISSRRTIASTSRQLQIPSVMTRPPHSGIHFDTPQICEHCRGSSLPIVTFDRS